jgi:hypothetical protein
MGEHLRGLLEGRSSLPDPTPALDPTSNAPQRLLGETYALGPTWRKTQLEDNWAVHIKETVTDGYVEYEVYSVLEEPSEEDLLRLESESAVFCHPEIEEATVKKGAKRLEFGMKAGCKKGT